MRLLLALVSLLGFAAVCSWLARDWRNRAIDARVARHLPLIRRHAQANTLPAELVRRVVRAESAGDERAVSPAGARGLMQVMPIAEREVLRTADATAGDLFEPDYNLRIGTAYLRMMVDRFGGDLNLALAAYNLGPTKVRRLCDRNPGLASVELVARFAPRETADYCRKILRDMPTSLPWNE
ncbi:MAG TPA: lytic transglycosylase domain-containing protein [Phycisphaerae bacterium]|nr:lytic transglycosylase domain-containing protein [Phycisphaerae bacterium]